MAPPGPTEPVAGPPGPRCPSLPTIGTPPLARDCHLARAFFSILLVLQSLAAGARGYMVKDIELAELKSAIRSIHRGHTVLDPKITGSLVARVAAPDSGAEPGRTRAARAATLSDLEVRIVRHLSEGHTIKEIAERVHLRSRIASRRFATSSRFGRERGSWQS